MKKHFENPAQSYVTPEIEVAEVISEGVLCQSGGTPLPSLKKSLAHVEYFWRGLEEKKQPL